MAIDCLTIFEINARDSFDIPEDATHYRTQSGKIRFFNVDPKTSHNFIEIPYNAYEMSFPHFEKNRNNLHYGEPRFFKKID